MDSFFEDRFKAREAKSIIRLAALQVIWGIRNGIQPWHDRMNIKAKATLAANGFKIPRVKIVRLL
jgi:hypothetical protein